MGNKELGHVLLIDDDEAVNFLHNVILTQCGCTKEIVTIDNAEDGLSHLKNSIISGALPDVIFLDLNMPGTDGWEFMAEFEVTFANTTYLPKIFIFTTSENPDDRLRASEFPHLTGFLNKPLTHEMVEQLILNHC